MRATKKWSMPSPPWRQRALGADAAVVFYAGLGIVDAEENYLRPVTSYRTTHGIMLDHVLAATRGATLRLVILNALFDYPWGGRGSRVLRGRLDRGTGG